MSKAWFIKRRHERTYFSQHGWVRDQAHAFRYPTAEDAAQTFKDARQLSATLMDDAGFVQEEWHDQAAKAIHTSYDPFGFRR